MKHVYTGSHASIDVPAIGRTVERGEAIDIEDTRLARQLRRQGWQRVRSEEGGGE